MGNVIKFSSHAINKTPLTHGAPADGSSGFYIAQNTDNYYVCIQPLLGSTVGTKVWLFYDITSDAADDLSQSDQYIITDQGDLFGDITGSNWKSYTLENVGAKGLYIEITKGTCNILIARDSLYR